MSISAYEAHAATGRRRRKPHVPRPPATLRSTRLRSHIPGPPGRQLVVFIAPCRHRNQLLAHALLPLAHLAHSISRYTPDGSLLGFTRRLPPAARDRDTPRGFLFGNAGAAARWLGGPRRLALLLIHPSYSSTASYSSTYSRTNQPIHAAPLKAPAPDASYAQLGSATRARDTVRSPGRCSFNDMHLFSTPLYITRQAAVWASNHYLLPRLHQGGWPDSLPNYHLVSPSTQGVLYEPHDNFQIS